MIWLNPKERLKQPQPTAEVAEVVETKEESASEKYTVKELRAMCKEKGITGYSKLKEAELIELLGL